eukprot:11178795-Lingulodinium_polyedra.AAC.1
MEDDDLEVLHLNCACSQCMQVPAADRGGQKRDTRKVKTDKKEVPKKKVNKVKKHCMSKEFKKPWKVALVQRQGNGKRASEAYLTVNK